MTVPEVLAELRNRNVQVWTDGDQLRCNAPRGVLTPALREELQRRKGDVIEFLRAAHALTEQARAVVPLQPRGSRIPIFAVPGHNGDVFCYRALARVLGDDQPLFGLQPPGLDGHSEPVERVEELATYFADQVRAFRPAGPYVIAGYCAGGAIAYELARHLQNGGATIGFVALFTSPHPTAFDVLAQWRDRLVNQARRAGAHLHALASLPNAGRCRYIAEKLRLRALARDNAARSARDPVLQLRARMERATVTALRRYTPQPFAGRVGLFLPNRDSLRPGSPLLRWRTLARNTEVYCGPDGCDGDHMLLDPHVSAIAELFRRCRERQAIEAGR